MMENVTAPPNSCTQYKTHGLKHLSDVPQCFINFHLYSITSSISVLRNMSFGRGVGNVLLKSNVKSNGKSGIQQSMIKAYVFTGNTPVHTHNVCSHSQQCSINTRYRVRVGGRFERQGFLKLSFSNCIFSLVPSNYVGSIRITYVN